MVETTYKIIWQREHTYAVEVTARDGARRTVAPFKQEAEVRAWIAEAKWKAAMSASKGHTGPPKKSG